MKKYIVTQYISDVNIHVEETVYEFLYPTYGMVADNEAMLGVPCAAVTRNSSGGYPFLVVPQHCIREL